MSKSPNTVVQDPRTPANLKRLTTVSIRCDVGSVAFLGVSPIKLKRTVTELLQDEGLKCDNTSKSRLVIGIAVETRDAGKHVVYAVEVALREPVPLPRAVVPLQMGEVDTWRHQTITGLLFAPYDKDQFSKSLVGEALRQVGALLEDWADVNDISPTIEDAEEIALSTAPLAPASEDWYSKTEKVRLALTSHLQQLARGPASTATLDRFDVKGTKVNFQGTITNFGVRMEEDATTITAVAPVVTVVTGAFDMLDPNTVLQQTLSAALPPGLENANVTESLADLAALFA